MLSAQLLAILRTYWRLARPKDWLFPGRDETEPIDAQVLHAACRSAVRGSGLGQAGDGAHAAPQLRHASAGERHRHPHHPGAARPRQSVDHGALHAGRRPTLIARTAEPARPADAGGRAARLIRRPCRSGAGGGGYLPPPRRRPIVEPMPAISAAVERRVMGAIELCRTAALGGHAEQLRRLRPGPHRLQLLPQPALPEVPGAGPRRVARRRGRPSCCRCRTSTSSSPCRRRSPRSRSRTRPWSTPSCSGRRPRRCAPSPPTPSISAPRSASSPCSIPGGRTCTIIRTSIASCRAAAHRSTARAGSPAGPASSCRCACSRGCSAGCSSSALQAAFDAGELGFFGDLAGLAEPAAFARRLRELRRIEWVVYAKPPFGGPEQVLDYLGRYTHRVAIANSRLVALTDGQVAFRWKDYRHHGKAKVDDARRRRVHPPLPAARPAGRLPPHPPLRLPRQRPPRRQARALPAVARRPQPPPPIPPAADYRERTASSPAAPRRLSRAAAAHDHPRRAAEPMPSAWPDTS